MFNKFYLIFLIGELLESRKNFREVIKRFTSRKFLNPQWNCFGKFRQIKVILENLLNIVLIYKPVLLPAQIPKLERLGLWA